ncbi:MAG TPA: hypothetical protein VJP81_07560 [Candidatus Dormibacteraeota bacterium]|nr:hypothetical protein [Candidatus Dormibacteraeota bacterium]
MTAERARSIAWLCFGLTVAFVPLSIFMLTRSPKMAVTTQDAWTIGVAFVGAFAFTAVGALIVSRHSRHTIGWIFTLSGLATAGAVLFAAYGELSHAPGWSLPAGQLVNDIGYVLLQSGVFLPLTLGLLLFPDGHLLSRRWWPAALLAFAGLILRLVGDSMDQSWWVSEWLSNIGVLATIGSAMAGLAALALRWRRAGPILRQQLKWITAAATLVVALFVVDVVIDIWNHDLIRSVEFLVFVVAYTIIPIAAGASILRYGLYQIDLIINRAIVYIALTAILAGLYAGFTATLQRLFVAFTGQSSDAAIVITVALIATLFTPVRNSLQRLVDTRFKDARDLERLMESLENEVGQVVDVIVAQRLAARLLRTAREGAGARGAALFLDGASEGSPSFTAGEWTGDAELVVPLRAGDQEIGRLALAPRLHGAPYAQRERERLQKAADMVAIGLTLARDRGQELVPL